MSIVSFKYQSTEFNPDLYQLFSKEAQEILEYVQETLLELTKPMIFPSFPHSNLAFTIDLIGILQSDATDLDIIEVQISAYHLEILLRSLQEKKLLEINSELERDILKAGEALRLSLLPYLNTEYSAKASVATETPPSLLCKDSNLDSNQTTGMELPTLDEFKILEDIEENINHVSSELALRTANLFVWLVGSDIFTISYDLIETNLMPKVEQIIQLEGQDFLQWQQQTIPIYRLSELLDAFTLPKPNSNLTRLSVFSSEMRLILIIRQGKQLIALDSAIERLVTQPELTIQPVDNLISYCYGFSWWKDENLVRVIDVVALLEQIW